MNRADLICSLGPHPALAPFDSCAFHAEKRPHYRPPGKGDHWRTASHMVLCKVHSAVSCVVQSNCSCRDAVLERFSHPESSAGALQRKWSRPDSLRSPGIATSRLDISHLPRRAAGLDEKTKASVMTCRSMRISSILVDWHTDIGATAKDSGLEGQGLKKTKKTRRDAPILAWPHEPPKPPPRLPIVARCRAPQLLTLLISRPGRESSGVIEASLLAITEILIRDGVEQGRCVKRANCCSACAGVSHVAVPWLLWSLLLDCDDAHRGASSMQHRLIREGIR